MTLPFDHEESLRVATQINDQWPFIPLVEARTFYENLGHINAAEGSVRVSLWVLAKVLHHNAKY